MKNVQNEFGDNVPFKRMHPCTHAHTRPAQRSSSPPLILSAHSEQIQMFPDQENKFVYVSSPEIECEVSIVQILKTE